MLRQYVLDYPVLRGADNGTTETIAVEAFCYFPFFFLALLHSTPKTINCEENHYESQVLLVYPETFLEDNMRSSPSPSIPDFEPRRPRSELRRARMVSAHMRILICQNPLSVRRQVPVNPMLGNRLGPPVGARTIL